MTCASMRPTILSGTTSRPTSVFRLQPEVVTLLPPFLVLGNEITHGFGLSYPNSRPWKAPAFSRSGATSASGCSTRDREEAQPGRRGDHDVEAETLRKRAVERYSGRRE